MFAGIHALKYISLVVFLSKWTIAEPWVMKKEIYNSAMRSFYGQSIFSYEMKNLN
jgi:hypothetical protein